MAEAHPNPMFAKVGMDEWASVAYNLMMRNLNDGNGTICIQSKRTRYFVKKLWSEKSGKYKPDIESALEYANELASRNGGWKSRG